MAHVLAKDLRDSVLEAAFKGDLSTHHATDSRIECYRNEVLNTTRITSKKDITKAIENDELNDMPDIPNNWTYVRLNDVVAIEIKRGKSPKYDEKGEALAFAQKCNSKYDGIQLKLAKHLSNESLSRYKEHENMKDYDIVINSTGGGTLGRVGLYREYYNQLNVPVYPDSHVTIIRAKNNVNSSYLYLYVKKLSPYLETLGEGSTNQTELKPQVLKDLLVPLPPIEEQVRIVAKVDEIMAKIDEYEKLENKLVKLKEQFPQDMKDSLLHSAFEGSFTNNSYIDNENSDWAFDKIVDGWNYQSYEDVCTITTGLSFPKTEQCLKSDSDLRILRGGNIYDDYRYRLKDDDIYVKYREKYTKLLSGDVITPSVTSLEKHCKVGFIENDLKNITAGGFVYIFRTKDMNMLLPRYLMYYITSPQNKAMCMPNIHKSGQAFYNLKKNGLIKQIIPIPPIEEQQRIVDKLDELLPLVDKLAELN